jgi:NAD(P)-dependent dehydrogenase (short-subunit alcohol dehydrogenase family)
MLAAAKTIGGRVAYAHDVAEAVAHFTLPELGWITGHVIGVDGGYDFIR